jgi:predicted dinucleotide-binding enzyme
MSYAIIGFGKLGQALAKAFARKGIEVSVATTRDPQSFASAAAAIGPTIIPKKLAEALAADIVFLAVRFESHRDVAKALPTWKGKTLIDVTNAYGASRGTGWAAFFQSHRAGLHGCKTGQGLQPFGRWRP